MKEINMKNKIYMSILFFIIVVAYGVIHNNGVIPFLIKISNSKFLPVMISLIVIMILTGIAYLINNNNNSNNGNCRL